jgi:ElaB/YqjD/DUF883 family membrane-anchored ribosome-binding protein
MASDTASTIHDIQGDLRQLREDVGRLTQQLTSLLSASGDDALGQIKGRVREMSENINSTVSDASERGREAVGEVSDTIGAAVESSLRDHPITTVALAIGLGFLCGTAWRR